VAVSDIVPVPGAQFEETLASASPDVLRAMIREFAHRMMDADVEVGRPWAGADYHGFSADNGTWSAVGSAGEVFTGATPDELGQKIRAHWQAMQ
jgi:hypothetical protein